MAYFHHRYSFTVMRSKYSYLPSFHQIVGFGCIFSQSKMALVFSLFCLFNYQGFLSLKTSQQIICFIIGFRRGSMWDFHEKDFVGFLRELLAYCWFNILNQAVMEENLGFKFIRGKYICFWNSNSLKENIFVRCLFGS